jgi:hypothetical protein
VGCVQLRDEPVTDKSNEPVTDKSNLKIRVPTRALTATQLISALCLARLDAHAVSHICRWTNDHAIAWPQPGAHFDAALAREESAETLTRQLWADAVEIMSRLSLRTN